MYVGRVCVYICVYIYTYIYTYIYIHTSACTYMYVNMGLCGERVRAAGCLSRVCFMGMLRNTHGPEAKMNRTNKDP